MTDITAFIKDKLLSRGADLVGVGDLTQFPAEQRWGMPFGVAIAVKYPPEIIRGIAEMPTREYRRHYDILNDKLEELVTLGAEALIAMGYRAQARPATMAAATATLQAEGLPHKTVATRAGLGWIGKCALLITPQYGAAVRLAPIYTDAPLTPAEPVNTSKCGTCAVCVEACPAGAVSGKQWSTEIGRDEFFNAALCRKTARARSMQALGEEISICGKCIAVCPWTKKYTDCI